MMNTTIMISISVKPASRCRQWERAMRKVLLTEVPVANVGIGAFTAVLAIGSKRVEVVLLSSRAREDVLVGMAPRIVADAFDVSAFAPVAHVGVVWPLRECLDTEIGARVGVVVELVHRERRFDRLNVALRLGDLRLLDVSEDIGQDH